MPGIELEPFACKTCALPLSYSHNPHLEFFSIETNRTVCQTFARPEGNFSFSINYVQKVDFLLCILGFIFREDWIWNMSPWEQCCVQPLSPIPVSCRQFSSTLLWNPSVMPLQALQPVGEPWLSPATTYGSSKAGFLVGGFWAGKGVGPHMPIKSAPI